MEERDHEPAPAGTPSGAAPPSAPDNPTVLFEEYVRRLETDPAPDVEALLSRAGARRDELEHLIRLWRTLESVRDGTTGGALPPELRRAPTVSRGQARLGRFEDLELLGEGGLSRVFLATDTQLQRRVALKVLHSLSLDAAAAHAWTLNEGRSIARLEHPGVVRVFEAGEVEGVAYIAMEHVRGPSLREVLRCLRADAGRPESGDEPVTDESRAAAAALRTVAARCELVAQIAEALACCHDQGVIHRDIKPANLLLEDGRRPKLIDFGLAHLESPTALQTQITQRLVGTPAYIAPEQVDNNRTGASEQSDQFSLGVMLVELLTLENPFARETRTETLDAISRAEPPRPRDLDPSMSEDLERICLHALEREPARRYAHVADLAGDLRAFLEHRAISLRPPTTAMLAGLWLRRHRRALALTLSAAAALAVLALGLRFAAITSARGDVQRELDGVQAQFAGRTTSEGFEVDYLALKDLRRSAAELDDSLLSRALLAPLTPRVTATIESCSRRVSELIASRLAMIEKTEAIEKEQRIEALMQQWSNVLRLDQTVCPECPYNRESIERGSVELPTICAGQELQLLRHDTLPVFSTASVLERVVDAGVRKLELPPAFYRLLIFDGAAVAGSRAEAAALTPADALRGVRELEFPLRRGELRRTAEPLPMSDAWLERLMACPGGPVTLGTGYPEIPKAPLPIDVEVEPFFIATGPVTWGDVAELWGSDRCAQIQSVLALTIEHSNKVRGRPPGTGAPAVGPEDPAILTWRDALRFATGSGARLPTVLEWHAACSRPGFTVPALPTVVSEWTSVSSYEDPHMRWAASYSGCPSGKWMEWSSQLADAGQVTTTTFRLARSFPSR